MDEFLAKLAERLQIPDADIVSADETEDWPTGKLDELVKVGVLAEIQHSKGVVCRECEENCFIEPDIRTHPDTGKTTGVFVCTRNPDIGRIEIELDRQRRWKINSTKLAKLGYATEQNNHHSEIPYEIGLLEEIADKLESWADERKTGFQNKIAEERQNENRYKTIGDFLKERDTFSSIVELSPIAAYFALPDLSDEFTFAVKSFQFNENFTPATMLVEIQNELYHKNIEIVKLAAEVSEHLDSYDPESLEYKSLLLQVRTLFAATIPEIAERIRKIAEMTKKKLVSSTKTQPAETGQKGISVKEPSKEVENVFKKSGDFWQVAYQGSATKTIKNSKGMSYIHRLLGKPDDSISAMELANKLFFVKLLNQGNGADYESVDTDLVKRQDLVDHDYLKQCKKRLSDIDDELAEAGKNNDLATQEGLKEEREEILNLLKTDTFGGISAKFSDHREKARIAATNAITRALNNIKKHNQSLYKHLNNSILRGLDFIYTPDEEINWVL